MKDLNKNFDKMANYIIELEKGLDWENGYLDFKGNPVTKIQDAAEYEEKQEAENAAALFNMTYGTSGRVYARVR